VSRFALTALVLMFVLIVVGSVVRTTGSGLACPDWPLCEGRIIPRAEPHVLIEWLHRSIALLLSSLLAVVVGRVFTNRDTRARLGGLAVLVMALFVVQVLLGALTVWKLLSPAMVSSHLAVALLLFSTLLVLTLVAASEADGEPEQGPARPPGLLALYALASVAVWIQAVIGGAVSSSHAGLACPDWPTCYGEWFPRMQGLVGLQMLHRFGAYAVAIVVLGAAAFARGVGDPRVRLGARMASSLVAAQVVLGVTNVLLGTPVWLSALHLATAVVLLGMLVTTTYRLARMPAHAPAFAVMVPEAR